MLSGSRARNVKTGSRTVPDTQISETDAVRINADDSQVEKLAPIFIQFVESDEP
jgi:hypothetical protein